jgi:hypothetical protein
MTTPAPAPPPEIPRCARDARKVAACVTAAVLLAVLAALFFFDPARHSIYPQCTLKRMTGLDCPGCGGLRATHQLLHGNVRAAFALNPLLFMVGPVVLWWLVAEAARGRGRRFIGPFDHRAGVAAFIAAVAVFGVLRNLW